MNILKLLLAKNITFCLCKRKVPNKTKSVKRYISNHVVKDVHVAVDHKFVVQNRSQPC